MHHQELWDKAAIRPARGWLSLGISALAIAGLFALVLVVARTPSLAQIPIFSHLFHDALVVHVDLSVLVWFLSIACMFWHMLALKSGSWLVIPYLERAAMICMGAGIGAMTLSPFMTQGEALMSNYIPVISNMAFFLGLAFVLCSVGLMALRLMLCSGSLESPMAFGAYCTMLTTVVAIVCFVWSLRIMPEGVFEGAQFYEIAFWGGGHVLQFTHSQILMLCWFALAGALCREEILCAGITKGCFAFMLVAACGAPVIYLAFDIASMEYRQFFTTHMILFGALGPVIFALAIFKARFTHMRSGGGAVRGCLFASLGLFLYGGILGSMIQGQNVVIPAHYHGSIVGITLAFMGVAYLLMPKFGWRDVSKTKLAIAQPWVYAIGQTMHISGLAWSGGYGVLRKTPGAANELSTAIKAAMGLMGLGGLLAIIGGLMFVIACWRGIRPKKA